MAEAMSEERERQIREDYARDLRDIEAFGLGALVRGGRTRTGAIGDLLAENDRLHTWDGLMSLLDRHYPPDVFDGSSGDPGPRIIALTREINLLRAGQPPLTDEYGIRTVYVSMLISEEPVSDELGAALNLLAAAKASGRTDVISREVIRREVGQWRDIEEGDDRG